MQAAARKQDSQRAGRFANCAQLLLQAKIRNRVIVLLNAIFVFFYFQAPFDIVEEQSACPKDAIPNSSSQRINHSQIVYQYLCELRKHVTLAQ